MRQGNFSLILSGVIAIIISIIMGAVAISELDTAATAANPQTTTTDITVATSVAGTTANATLLTELWENDITNVISMTSNITETTGPTAVSYTAADNNLLMSGLTVNQTRTVAVVYYDMPNEFDALYSVMGIYGLVIWVILTGAALAMIGFGAYGAIKSARRR